MSLSQSQEVAEVLPPEDALLEASADGVLSEVIELVEVRGAPLDCEDKVTGMTPLIAASANGHFRVVEYLVIRGADKRKYDSNGNTAIHVAAEGDHLAVVQFLIDCGGDMNKSNDFGKRADERAKERIKTFFRLARMALGRKVMDDNACFNMVRKDNFALWYDMVRDGFLSSVARRLVTKFPETLLDVIVGGER